MKNKFITIVFFFLYKDTGHPGEHTAELHVYQIEPHAEKKKYTRSSFPSLLYWFHFFFTDCILPGNNLLRDLLFFFCAIRFVVRPDRCVLQANTPPTVEAMTIPSTTQQIRIIIFFCKCINKKSRQHVKKRVGRLIVLIVFPTFAVKET